MTDVEKSIQRAEVIAENEKAQEELANQTIKIERIADKFDRISRALRNHPELVTGTPEIGKPDYRSDLNFPTREQLLADCAELIRLQNWCKTAERRLRVLNGQTKQATVD